MNSEVAAVVVAVAGVAGTLASAVITQVLVMRARSREVEVQNNHRREDHEQALQNAQRAEVKTAIASYIESFSSCVAGGFDVVQDEGGLHDRGSAARAAAKLGQDLPDLR